MIKKNELRIGNYVRVHDFYCTITHLGESTLGYRVMDNKTGGTYDLIQPIELTEDIIIKCGFEQWEFIKREFNKKGDYNFRAINHYENGFLIICNFMQGGIMTKYLHKLQNLYFELTGEELNVELKTVENLSKV